VDAVTTVAVAKAVDVAKAADVETVVATIATKKRTSSLSAL
jgi:hypothetical protein